MYQTVTLPVMSLDIASSSWWWYFFANVNNFNIIDFTLLIQDFQIIFVNLEDEATVFGTIVSY